MQLHRINHLFTKTNSYSYLTNLITSLTNSAGLNQTDIFKVPFGKSCFTEIGAMVQIYTINH